MSKELFVNYYIGEETYGTLNTIPAYVDIVPLAFVHIKDLKLDFSHFVEHVDILKSWVKIVQANRTKVLFSLQSSKLGSITGDDLTRLLTNVKDTVKEWGIDGFDFDYEPDPVFGDGKGENLVNLVKAFRETFKAPHYIFTVPIYGGGWLGSDAINTLKALVPHVDYFASMDYNSDYQSTIDVCNTWAGYVTWEKLLIGMICMGPEGDGSLTDFDAVAQLAKFKPDSGNKAGVMLYTFNYDRRTRKSKTNQGEGTGYSNLAYTETIHANLL